jgi:hypothetical protein
MALMAGTTSLVTSPCSKVSSSMISLADSHALERDHRIVQQTAELGKDLGDLVAGADRDDHHRNAGVAAKNFARVRRPRLVPSTPRQQPGAFKA